MGVGKSSVGKKLASDMRWPLLDLDRELEKTEGTSVVEIFSNRGEDYFRKKEYAILSEVSLLNHTIVALGGGTLMSPKNKAIIGKSGILVILTAPIEVLVERLKEEVHLRPLVREFSGQALATKLSNLLSERAPYYLGANLTIETKSKSIDDIADEIKNYLEQARRKL